MAMIFPKWRYHLEEEEEEEWMHFIQKTLKNTHCCLLALVASLVDRLFSD